MTHQEELDLLARMHAGDKNACAACVEAHAPGLYRLALRIVRDEAAAEDVVQETFLNAFRAIGSFDGRARLNTWLYRIAYNAALGHLRRARPTVSMEETHDQTDEGQPLPTALFDWCCLPESDFESTEARTELENAIRDLPENLRVVFVLRELNGLSTEETAQALEVNVPVVKTRLHRARLWLRQRLAAYFTELAHHPPETA